MFYKPGRNCDSLAAWLQVRGLQAQLADARQQQKEQASDKAALQARLQAANNQATAHDADNSKLQVDAVHALICLFCHPPHLVFQALAAISSLLGCHGGCLKQPYHITLVNEHMEPFPFLTAAE